MVGFVRKRCPENDYWDARHPKAAPPTLPLMRLIRGAIESGSPTATLGHVDAERFCVLDRGNGNTYPRFSRRIAV